MKIRTTTAASVTGLLGRPKRSPPGMTALYRRLKSKWESNPRTASLEPLAKSRLVL
jgi:hypothetical protein